MPSSELVNDWHDAGFHHKHSGLVGGLPLTVCCVCDNDDPCHVALDDANWWDDRTCPGRWSGDRRCNAERGDNRHGYCAEHMVEHYEAMRERYLLDRHNDRTGATL